MTQTQYLATPCGMCRQVISEFVGSGFQVIIINGQKRQTFTIDELLPHPFTKEDFAYIQIKG